MKRADIHEMVAKKMEKFSMVKLEATFVIEEHFAPDPVTEEYEDPVVHYESDKETLELHIHDWSNYSGNQESTIGHVYDNPLDGIKEHLVEQGKMYDFARRRFPSLEYLKEANSTLHLDVDTIYCDNSFGICVSNNWTERNGDEMRFLVKVHNATYA